MFVTHLNLASQEAEYKFFELLKRTCYDTFYPFKIFLEIDLKRLEFAPITILYGGNGSGKTTILNIIAEKLALQRRSLYNRTNFFDDYVRLCRCDLENRVNENSWIITSDDVFDYMLDLRALNSGIDHKREELFSEYNDAKYINTNPLRKEPDPKKNFKFQSLDDYDTLKKINHCRHTSQSKYVRNHLMPNVREQSNGESAFFYFVQRIKENALYLLDEPENSLSPKKQIELVKYLEDSARYFNCQFIIATHSPFMLSIENARIYDLDARPIRTKHWTQLENVKLYYDFFKQHQYQFKT